MFEKIKNAIAIARRSELIRKHEADYTALLEEKVKAEGERDSALMTATEAITQRDKASELLDLAESAEATAVAAQKAADAKVSKYEQQLTELAKQLGLVEEEPAVEAEAKPAVAEAVAEEEPAPTAQAEAASSPAQGQAREVTRTALCG